MEIHLPSASLVRRLGPSVLAAVLCALPWGLGAQPLGPLTVCPAGSPPVNLRPLFSPYGGTGIPLIRRTIDTALYPNAKCNDDSPAVIYIRPANAAFNNNPIVNPTSKWVIFLDGGGGCRNADACLEDRWCSGSGQIFDRAGKMSTKGLWGAVDGTGIFSANPVNHFVDYNMVIVNYCSSDNWIGSQDYVALPTTAGATYDIRFQGEAIVNAVIDTLLAGPTAPDADVAAGYYPTALPSLADASLVVLSGESAGAGGMRHHMDRLNYDKIVPAATNPNIVVRGLLDAGFSPWLGDPAINWGAVAGSPGHYRDHLLTNVAPAAQGFWGADDSALDQSCLDPAWIPIHFLLHGGSHPEICLDTTYTLLNHITTPTFLRHDINDPLAKDPYVLWGLYPTNDDYWQAQFDQLVLFGHYSSTFGGLELPDGDSGVQAINCSQHVAIQTKAGFFDRRVKGPGLVPRSFHDLVTSWIANVAKGPEITQYQFDNAGAGVYTVSHCP